MKNQSGSNDSGLFALASVCELCYGSDPSLSECVSQAEMRRLSNALDVKRLQIFYRCKKYFIVFEEKKKKKSSILHL